MEQRERIADSYFNQPFDIPGQGQVWPEMVQRQQGAGHAFGDQRGVLDGRSFAETGQSRHRDKQSAFLDDLRAPVFKNPDRTVGPGFDRRDQINTNMDFSIGDQPMVSQRDIDVRRAQSENYFYQDKYNSDSNLTNNNIRDMYSY